MTRIFAVMLGVAALGAPTTASAVQVQCAKHEAMVRLLEQRYTENPVAMGSINDERYMQLFVNVTKGHPDEGSWTILVTQTNGEACILAAGSNLETLQIAPQQASVERPS